MKKVSLIFYRKYRKSIIFIFHTTFKKKKKYTKFNMKFLKNYKVYTLSLINKSYILLTKNIVYLN